MTDQSNLIVGQLEACTRWNGEMGPYGWQAGYAAVGSWVLEAIGRDDADQLHEASEALRDAIAAAPEDFHDERVGWLSGLLALIRVCMDKSPLPPYRSALEVVRESLAKVGPDEVLDEDVPAEDGRRWVLSHENGLKVIHAYNAARRALGDESA